MEKSYPLKVDAYAHISPPRYTALLKKDHPGFYNAILHLNNALFDMDERFRIMDDFPDVVQVLTIGPVPPLEAFADATKSVELAKMANDEMAELIQKHRDRFIAAIPLLPMNNVKAAIAEAERTIKDLGFRGIYVHSNINGKPLDSEEFFPLYQMAVDHNLPVFIHPWRGDDFTDYQTEEKSKYFIASIFGWPYETTVAMTRLVFSGIFEKFPGLKVITHHCGGMVPYYAQRIHQHYGSIDLSGRQSFVRDLKKTPLEYYKMFYADTAIHGNTPALMLAYSFFGADHIVFGADMPLGDHYWGRRSYRETINAIEAMDIPESDKQKIFCGNALSLMRLFI
jgi:uncharacterized protein